jgi:Region in Clathrin and VPS
MKAAVVPSVAPATPAAPPADDSASTMSSSPSPSRAMQRQPQPQHQDREPAFSLALFPPTAVPNLLRRVTAAAASAKLVLLGYADGSLALFDVFGNPLDVHQNRHASAVTAVALGAGAFDDDVAASADAFGLLRVTPLFDSSSSPASPTQALSSVLSVARGGLSSVHLSGSTGGIAAVAVDPDFGKPRAGERVAYADGQGKVALYTAGWGWFGGSEAVIAAHPALGEDERVEALVWTGLLIAWATPLGVRIYDTRIQQTVCFVESPVHPSSVPDSVPPLSPSSSPCPPCEGKDSLPAANHVVASAPGAAEPWIPASTATANATWSTKTSMLFEIDERPSATVYGERPQKLYIAWPSVAKVITIGPHIDYPSSNAHPAVTIGGAAASADSATNETSDTASATTDASISRARPPRTVSTALTLPRSALPEPTSNAGVDSALATNSRKQDIDASAAASPLLSIAPFGEHYAVLVGSVLHGLILVRVTRENTGDMHSLRLPLGNVMSAELWPIPGGEPFLLIAAQHLADGTNPTSIEMDTNKARESAEKDTVADVSSPSTTAPSPSGASTALTETFSLNPPEGTGVMFAHALGIAERIKWLLDQGRFEDALTAAQVAPGGSLRRAEVSITDVGDQFLESIHRAGDFKRLTDVLPRTLISTSPSIAMRGLEKVMRIRRERWSQWISTYRTAGHLELIAPIIPCHEPRMIDDTYNNILIELADSNPAAMLGVLKTWPADVYDVPLVTRAVEVKSAMESSSGANVNQGTALCLAPHDGKADDVDDPVREALFMLYGLSGRHDETLNLLLHEGSDRVFSYVKAHDLYEAIRSSDAMCDLYSIDKQKATELLTGAPGTLLPPESVVPILKTVGNAEWLCSYLYSIFRQDSERASEYQNLLLELLIEHGKDGSLYNFLRTSSHFSLDSALTLMGGRGGKTKGLFGRERVYVLATMGDLNAAMDVLLSEVKDVHGAIEFASEHNDVALWDRLIEHARGDAEILAALLDSPSGGKVNPVRLIPLITNLEIPNLKDRLHRILVDAALERDLREETAATLHYDASILMAELDASVDVRTPRVTSSCRSTH